jgi:hypothetical protein
VIVWSKPGEKQRVYCGKNKSAGYLTGIFARLSGSLTASR